MKRVLIGGIVGSIVVVGGWLFGGLTLAGIVKPPAT